MTESVQIWIIGGLAAIGVLFMGAIWAEIRGMRSMIQGALTTQATHAAEITTVKERIARLPCLQPRGCERT